MSTSSEGSAESEPTASEIAAAAPDPYASWRLVNFRRYAFSWFCMTIARQIETVAVAVYVYAKTGSELSLGLVALTNALPAMLFAIPGGQLADRIDRRLVLVSALSVSTLLSVVMMTLCAMHFGVVWIYPCLAMNAVSQSLGAPSRTALLPWLVPVANFRNAVSWNSTIYQMGTMIGPALGGALMSVSASMGVALALATVAVCRLLGVLGIARLRTDRPPVTNATAVSLASLAAGIRFVSRNKPILAAISLDLFAVLLGGATYLLAPFSKISLHATPAEVGGFVGWLRSSEAVGAIFMAFVLTHLPAIRNAGRTLLFAVAAFGLATVGLGLAPTLPLAMLAMFLIGAFDNISVVVRHTMIQMLTPDAMRGRVSAVNNVFIVASNDLGGVESGVTAYYWGAIPSIIVGGVGSIVVVLTTLFAYPQILKIGSLADLRPAEEEETIAERS